MRTTGKCGATAVSLILVLLAVARADDEIVIPNVGRPHEHFYNAAGTAVKVRFQATPTEVALDDWIQLTLSIAGLLNPADVEKPDLSKVRGFERFQVEALPDPNVRESGCRVFAYRLRARDTDVTAIPPLPFRYFNPKVMVEDANFRFPFTATESIPLKVTAAKGPPPRQVVPLDVPAFAEQLADSDSVLSTPTDRIFYWYFAFLVVLISPALAWRWVVAWRKRYPDAARQAHLRRRRAARHALSALYRFRRDRSADPGAGVAEAVLRYLQERFEVPAWARTPADAAEQLGRTNADVHWIASVKSVLQACDAARFAPQSAGDREALAAAAERVILASEAAA